MGWVYYYTIILATGNRQGWALDKIDLLHYLDRDTGRPLQYDFLTDLHQKRFFFGGVKVKKNCILIHLVIHLRIIGLPCSSQVFLNFVYCILS